VGGGGLRHLVVRLRLHGVNEVGELDPVLDEEDRHIVPDQIEVALVGVELHREPSHVAHGVGRAARAGHRGEANEDRGLRLGILKEAGPGPLLHRLVDLEKPVGGGPARVHHALGNPFVVEPGDLLAQVEVFEERGSALTGLERVIGVVDAYALVGGKGRLRGVIPERLEAAIFARPPVAIGAAAVALGLHGWNDSLGSCDLQTPMAM
jgi:hypothetical protein